MEIRNHVHDIKLQSDSEKLKKISRETTGTKGFTHTLRENSTVDFIFRERPLKVSRLFTTDRAPVNSHWNKALLLLLNKFV